MIDWSQYNCRPVPKEDLERFRASVREMVIKPYIERQRRRAQLADEVRRRVVL